MAQRKIRRADASTSWDPVAEWYTGWVGTRGSEHHRRLAIPAVLELLAPRAGEQILDLGAGPGVLARYISRGGAGYTGVDASPRLLAFARQHHGAYGRFLHGDVTRLDDLPELRPGSFDAVVFMLSIQDIQPLAGALSVAAWALRRGGRCVLLMTHPCFRVPRQSGWGWDRGRRLIYRRVDRYLTPLAVPMKVYGPRRGQTTRSFHRPLAEYINGLGACGLLVDCVREIPGLAQAESGPQARAEQLANQEIPLFLGLRALKR